MDLRERLGAAPSQAAANGRDTFAEVKNRIHMAVISELGPQTFSGDSPPQGERDRVLADIRGRLDQEPGIAREDRERLAAEITDDIFGHGPLERPLADDTITEIMINGPHDIWIERQGRLHHTPIRFTDESHLRRIINKIVAQVGRRIDESSPMVDARLPDGSRVNAVLPPLSLSGPLVTIRKFSRKRLDLGDLVNLGTLNPASVDFLEACVRAELNILISGGTGSGKTTLLNAMSTTIPGHERIVTIEDAAELRLNQRHVLRLEARPKNIEGEGEIPIRALVRNSLRMRPDRIIVGEVRGAEALDMLQAMNTGHDGSLCTVHANAPRDALARIETMVLMAGYDLPVRAIRQQVASALELIVHLERLSDGSRKVTAITEVQRMESDVITLQELFAFKVEDVMRDGKVIGALHGTGLRPSFMHKFEKCGIKLDMSTFQDDKQQAAQVGMEVASGNGR
jgi:pilus assembly protein CpaF